MFFSSLALPILFDVSILHTQTLIMSAPHVPASQYYKESHGGVEKVNADPFAAGVRSTQQSR